MHTPSTLRNPSRSARRLPLAAALLAALGLAAWLAIGEKPAPAAPRTADSLVQSSYSPQIAGRQNSKQSSPAPASISGFPPADRAAAAPLPWRLAADARPRSHRQKDGHSSLRTPRRSARLEIQADFVSGAVPGGQVAFDLGAGLIVEGEYVSVRPQTMPGVDAWAGVLLSPPGVFQLEHHSRGWAGIFQITGSTEVIQLIPDRFEPGVSRLEVWDKRETVCASRDEDGDPVTAPPADPDINHLNLQSRPGAENVIYIDFNGETVSGTTWNNFSNSFNDIVAAPSGMTRDEIVAIWARSAEDWITFNVNVTTSRAIYNDTAWHSRAMVVCTPTKQWYTEGEDGIGGTAQHDSFNNLALSQICWSFNVENYLVCAETVSHECGHMMGNSHSSTSGDEYYDGHVTTSGVRWAPIMGWSPAAGVHGLTQFSNGDYKFATNTEDQIDEIEYELDPIADENSMLIPEVINMTGSSKKVKGLMNSGGDIDSYVVDLPSGGWIVSVEPNPCGPNIDCLMSLRRFPDNTLVERRDNTDGANNSLSASINVPAAGGIFRINIGSDASLPSSSWQFGDYSNYGGIGSYTLRIKRPPGFESSPPVLSSVVMSGLTQGSTTAEAEVTFLDAAEFSRFFGTSPSVPVTLERISGGVTVSGSAVGGKVYATDDTGDDTIHTARRKFRFSAPGGRWDAPEVGSYRIRIGAGAAMDEWNNVSAATTTTVGSLAPDTTPPVITAVITPKHLADGTNDPVHAEITITDDSPITVTDYGTNCFEAISAQGAPPITLYRFGTSVTDGGRKWTMTCRAYAPGTWNEDEVGSWNIQVRTGKVRDSVGNITTPSVLGKFHVAASLYFEDFETNTGTTGFTFDTGWAHGSPTGSGSGMEDPADGSSGSRCIGYELGVQGHYPNNMPERSATTPLVDTTGHEGIVLRYRRWLKRHPGDGARIEINDASGGDAWIVVWNAPSDSTTNDRGWTTHEILLPGFVANSAVQVRWVMGTTNGKITAGGWNVDDVELLSTATWRPGELVVGLPPLFIVQEGGSTANYTVRLNQQPFFPVTVNILDGADLNVNDTSLSFHSGNWSVPQTVIVTAVNDTIVEGNELTKIRHTCTTFDSTFRGVTRDANVAVVDNDTPIIATQPQDQAVLPGESATLSLTVTSGVLLPQIQWYEGLRGTRARAIDRATGTTLTVTLDAKIRGPQYYYARVTGGGRTEDTRQATLSELTGEPAFNERLKRMGYTDSDFRNPQFDNLDPDGNGLTHFAEYALGLLPGRPPRWALSIVPVPALSGQPGEIDLLIQLPELRPGVRYTLQSSTDSNAWTDVIELQSDTLPEGPPVIRVPGGGSPKLMARLKLGAAP